jgi:hypothetical protein
MVFSGGVQMTSFMGFTEAAQLYARYSAVVDAMEKAFHESVNQFLDFSRDQIRQQVQPAKLQESRSDAARNWWLADNDEDMDAYPRGYVDPRSPRIVDPGELSLFVFAPRASEEQRRRFANIANQSRFRSFCKRGSGGPYFLFTAVIKYPEQENPADRVASIIADILVALNEIVLAPEPEQHTLFDKVKK